MDVIIVYIVFALSTAITCWFFFYRRALLELKAKNIQNQLTQRPVLSSIVYILISTVIAPLLVFPLLSRTAGTAFYESTLSGLAEPDE